MVLVVDSGWYCYGTGCPQKNPHPENRPVARIRDAVPDAEHNLEYLCPTCLFEAVRTGRLAVSLPSAETKAAPTEEVAETTYTVPVRTEDDGTIAVEGVEFRW